VAAEQSQVYCYTFIIISPCVTLDKSNSYEGSFLVIYRTVNRPVDLDFPQPVDTVPGPTQGVQGDHATRKAVPRQLDFTSMYGGPAGSAEGPVRTQPPVYGILNPTQNNGHQHAEMRFGI
jgi:hypothetical protein